MKISNHRLTGVDYQPAKAIGKAITPTIIIVHDTASRLNKFSAMKYLLNNKRSVSVHFVVERDGTITQSVPCNRRANHAGRSTYHGVKHCNNFSIGIEIVNPGAMTQGKPGFARAWYAQEFDINEYGIEEMSTRVHGTGWWMPYTEEQISAVESICEACADKYDIKDIVAHWYISPGRKFDTNPLFPLGNIKSRVLGREDAQEDEADNQATSVTSDEAVTIHVPGSNLNMRRWPSFNPNVITSIPHGTEVPLISKGTFDSRKWFKVIYDGQEGWIVARYAKA